MQQHDEKMEKYLNEFRPRAVRPLGGLRLAKKVWMGRLAAAALVLLSAGGALWYSRHAVKMSTPLVNAQRVRIDFRFEEGRPNAMLLTKMALEDPKGFEQQLEAESRNVLPDLQGQQSTLRVLAKE
jgi:hypothetical protein